MLFTWLLLVAAFGALGGLFFDRIGRIEPSWAHLYDSIWAGLALTVLGLVVWHFFLPVSAALGPFASLSGAVIVVERRWFRPLLQIRSHLPIALGAFALVVWTANHSLAGGGMDDYNYEFQAVRWFFDYPLVPGLANLHGRLGFNNSHHLLAALLSAGRWAGYVNHLVNGFVVALTLVYVLVAIVRVARRPGPPDTVPLFAAVLVAPTIGLVLFGIFGPAISTLKADVAVTAGVVILSCVFLRFACVAPGTSEYRVSAATAILVGCLLVTIKLSAAAFCAVILCVVMFRVARDFRRTAASDVFPRLPMFAAAAGAMLVGGFLLRGVILSGYPLYPSSVFGLNVDWRVPPALVEADRVFIKTWAQLRPTYDMAQVAGQEWVRGWLNSLILTQKLSIVLPFVILVVLGHASTPRKESDPVSGMWGLPVLAAASSLALLVWLTQAPAARFASIYFWIPLACVVVALVVQDPRPEIGRRLAAMSLGLAGLASIAIMTLLRYSRVDAIHQPGVLVVVAFAAVWAITLLVARHRANVLLTLYIVLGVSQIGERVAAHALRGRFDEIAAMGWYNVHALPEEPVFWYTVRHTDSGQTIYHTDATSFNTPIPNTRYFNRYLELRTPGDLRNGFRNPASASTEFGYTVHYVSWPSGGTEIVTPPRE